MLGSIEIHHETLAQYTWSIFIYAMIYYEMITKRFTELLLRINMSHRVTIRHNLAFATFRTTHRIESSRTIQLRGNP